MAFYCIDGIELIDDDGEFIVNETMRDAREHRGKWISQLVPCKYMFDIKKDSITSYKVIPRIGFNIGSFQNSCKDMY